jgi:glutamate synthase domain-containing protein 3
MKTIDALGVCYRDLNSLIDDAVRTDGIIVLKNVFGQRYIGRGLPEKVKLKIYGTPGNDMAAYMNGAELEIFSNSQDTVGNTMNYGKIVVHGNCGDTLGYAMRGGEIYVEKNVGYRAGIHMKEYQKMKPVIVVGGKTGDFLGEYMAGGVIILLGLDLAKGESITGKFCGTGMHGGAIYINGVLDNFQLGREIMKVVALNDGDVSFLKEHINFYSNFFKKKLDYLKLELFSKYVAVNLSPYANMYCTY